MSLSSQFTRSVMTNAPAERVWTTLKSFDGNEKFNALGISSRVDGYDVGSKRVCYVTMNVGNTISKAIEILTSLNDRDRTMACMVQTAPNTPFEGFKLGSYELTSRSNECAVEFAGNFEAED